MRLIDRLAFHLLVRAALPEEVVLLLQNEPAWHVVSWLWYHLEILDLRVGVVSNCCLDDFEQDPCGAIDQHRSVGISEHISNLILGWRLLASQLSLAPSARAMVPKYNEARREHKVCVSAVEDLNLGAMQIEKSKTKMPKQTPSIYIAFLVV